MWRLTSDTLPTVASKRQGAPVATIWVNAERGAAPICRIFTEGESFALPPEQAIGYRYVAVIPSKSLVLGVTAATLVRDWALEANTYQVSRQRVDVVVPDKREIRIQSKIVLPTPAHDNYRYVLDLSVWENFVVTGLSSEGLDFFPALDPDNLEHPEWNFIDNILTFLATSICAPRAKGVIEISGDFVIESDNFTDRVSKFTFPVNQEFEDLDLEVIDFQGSRYLIANEIPKTNNFIWHPVSRTAFIFKNT